MNLDAFIASESEKIRERSLWRELSVLEGSGAADLVLEGKKYLNFSSNDYLGYARHPEVLKAAAAALKTFGAGGKSSRLISGTLDLHAQLENKLADLKGTESALVFPTGFMANLGVISALLGDGDAVILDRLNHASIVDAAKYTRCRPFVYAHASPESLEKVLLRTKNYGKRLVVTDSLFSMDGDLAPLRAIADLCDRHGAWLMIDDAHATGVFGLRGSGLLEHWGLAGRARIVMGTLSKALGSQGGFVCGSRELTDFLKNRARTFIYTTALAPACAAAALKALDLVGREPEKRKKLLRLSAALRKSLGREFKSGGKLLGDSGSQIVPFWIGSAEAALSLAKKLKAAGIFAPAIRPPTVPSGECRLRFSLSSDHEPGDLDRLLAVLRKEAAA